MGFKNIAVSLAAAGLVAGGLALMAGPAGATTGTCLGTQNPVSGPVSCGGLFLPGMETSSSQPDGGTLSLTTSASGNYWNSPLSFGLYNSSDPKQDFTVYERC